MPVAIEALPLDPCIVFNNTGPSRSNSGYVSTVLPSTWGNGQHTPVWSATSTGLQWGGGYRGGSETTASPETRIVNKVR